MRIGKKLIINPIQQCMVCDLRNRCGQTIHRPALS